MKDRSRRGSVLGPAADVQHSIGPLAARRVHFACITAAAALLAAAEPATLRVVRAGAVVPEGGRLTGGAHHHYALALLALAMLPMGWGATAGRSRPAALALLALALTAAAVVLAVDRPVLRDTGLIGRTYELAHASAGTGFWLECAGATLALGAAALAISRS